AALAPVPKPTPSAAAVTPRPLAPTPNSVPPSPAAVPPGTPSPQIPRPAVAPEALLRPSAAISPARQVALNSLRPTAVTPVRARVTAAKPPAAPLGGGAMGFLGGLGGGGIVKGGGSKHYEEIGVLDLRGVPAREV